MAGRKKGRGKPVGTSPKETPGGGKRPSRPVKVKLPDEPRDDLRRDMLRSVVTEPLISLVRARPKGKFDVIIALNELFEGGIAAALQHVKRRADEWGVQYSTISHYCFARLSSKQILELADEARDLTAKLGRNASVVYRIWEDSDIGVTLTRSLTTVKADAAQRAFQAAGEGIVWAVLDSGIQGDHPHFAKKQTPLGNVDTLSWTAPLEHRDYTPDGDERAAIRAKARDEGRELTDAEKANSALIDRFGHGSHVAGIIGGYWRSEKVGGEEVVATEVRDERTDSSSIISRESLQVITGVAPLCRLISLKVIADITRKDDYKQSRGQGKVSWVLRAIDDVQQWNQYGKRLMIHGVNMSLGYDFDPRWFACGQSPICAEVNRLVRSGVCVVVSAGNGGYSSYITASGKAENSYNGMSITDPGNAELAITIGSTHRDMPHTYGVSYFSSRGPTGDGRRKPDLLAPGERIRSCAAGAERERYEPLTTGPTATGKAPILYCEQTGTSMAAPHVSGAVAAFLSVRTEFQGQPERVKDLLLRNAIDLGRERTFQGAGLLDLMKVLQAV